MSRQYDTCNFALRQLESWSWMIIFYRNNIVSVSIFMYQRDYISDFCHGTDTECRFAGYHVGGPTRCHDGVTGVTMMLSQLPCRQQGQATQLLFGYNIHGMVYFLTVKIHYTRDIVYCSWIIVAEIVWGDFLWMGANSVPDLLMPWLPMTPGHQQLWYRPCKIDRRYFNIKIVFYQYRDYHNKDKMIVSLFCLCDGNLYLYLEIVFILKLATMF